MVAPYCLAHIQGKLTMCSKDLLKWSAKKKFLTHKDLNTKLDELN